MFKKITVWGVACMLALLLISPASAADKIKVGYIVDINMGPFFVALEKGYFKKRGLELEIKEYVSGKDAYAAIKGGVLDIFQNMGANAVAKFYTQGLGIYMIRAWTLPHFKMLTKKDSPYKKITDLKGKPYAVTSYAGTTFAISAMAFNAVGLNIMKDVEVKTYPPAVMQVEMIRGGVGAGILWEPRVYKVLKTNELRILADPGKIYIEKFKKPFFHGATGCMKEYFDKNRPALKKYLEAINEGIQFTLKNREAAAKIQAPYQKGYTWQDVLKIRDSWGDGWIKKDINPAQIKEMQFMYDKMVALTKYFKKKPVAAEVMQKP